MRPFRPAFTVTEVTLLGLAALSVVAAEESNAPTPITDKTLVAWVSPENL